MISLEDRREGVNAKKKNWDSRKNKFKEIRSQETLARTVRRGGAEVIIYLENLEDFIVKIMYIGM